MTEPLKLVPPIKAWESDTNAACIEKLEQMLETAKTRGIKGFAVIAVMDDENIVTAYSSKGLYGSLLGGIELIKKRILDNWV